MQASSIFWARFFAAESAFSLPVRPAWPRIHRIVTRCPLRWSSALQESICWIAFDAFCESQKIVTGASLSCNIFIAISNPFKIAHSSASKTSLFSPQEHTLFFPLIADLFFPTNGSAYITLIKFRSICPQHQSSAISLGFLCVFCGFYNHLYLKLSNKLCQLHLLYPFCGIYSMTEGNLPR